MPGLQLWSLHRKKDALELENIWRGTIKCMGQSYMSNDMVGWNWKRDNLVGKDKCCMP